METANLGGHFGGGKKSGELKGTDMIKLCFLIGLVTQKPMRAKVNPSPYLPSTPCTRVLGGEHKSGEIGT